jgi:hypothetical protein
MIAKINKKPGNFDKCMEIIDSLDDSDLGWLKVRFKKECSDMNTHLIALVDI